MHGSVHVFRLVLANSLFSLRDINLTAWTHAPPEDTWYGVILWVLRVLGQGLKSECADIFHQSFLWLLRHTDDPREGRNSCVWLQSRAVLSSFGVVLMFCRVNREIKIPVYGERQTSNLSLEFLRIVNKQIKTVQNNCYGKHWRETT